MRTQLQAMGLTRWMFAVGLVFALVLTISVLQSGTAIATSHPNEPPDCTNAVPSPAAIGKNNKKFVPVNLVGVTDPDGDEFTISIFSIRQDEPVGTGKHAPDAIIDGGTAHLRAERDGKGDGRFYQIVFVATNDSGYSAFCQTLIAVTVAKGNKEPVLGGLDCNSAKPGCVGF